ncbi:MAG: nuclear transport factor 2 family protein [Flavobacteriaceae bacterium]
MTIEARLRRLEDIEAIRLLLRQIARGTDRFDGALLAAAIHPDAVLNMGGTAPMSGTAFTAALKPPAAPRPGRMHFVTNECIDVCGDVATSETYILSCQDVLVDDVRKTRLRAGRYLDRFERRDGDWKLSARTLVDEWSRVDEVTEALSPGAHVGRPAPDDLSYPT